MSVSGAPARPSETPAPAPEDRASARSPRAGRSFARYAPIATPVAFLVLLLPGFGLWLGGDFLDAAARLFDVHQNSPALLIAVGLVLVMATHNFDLSVASLATLVAILALGLSTKQGLPFALVVVSCLAVSVAAGLVNGFLVAVVRLNAFIATLGTGALLAGLGNVYTGGQHVNASGDSGPPSWFVGTTSMGSFLEKVPPVVSWLMVAALAACAALVMLERVPAEARRQRLAWSATIVAVGVVVGAIIAGKTSWTILLLVVVTLVVWALMRYTVAGRNLYAVGGNATAARLAGVDVDRHVILAFVGTAVLAGIGGLALAATQGSAAPGLGDSFLLPAYAAIFLGAVMFADGRYHVWGTLLAGICVVWVAQGLITGGVAHTWLEFINGAVLIGAVAVSSLLKRRGT